MCLYEWISDALLVYSFSFMYVYDVDCVQTQIFLRTIFMYINDIYCISFTPEHCWSHQANTVSFPGNSFKVAPNTMKTASNTGGKPGNTGEKPGNTGGKPGNTGGKPGEPADTSEIKAASVPPASSTAALVETSNAVDFNSVNRTYISLAMQLGFAFWPRLHISFPNTGY